METSPSRRAWSFVHPRIRALRDWFDRPISATLHRHFVCWFAIKLVLEPVLRIGPLGFLFESFQDVLELFQPLAHRALIVGCAIVLVSRRLQWVGLAICFAVRLVESWQQFPYTGNHPLLETATLGILLLWPPRVVSGPTGSGSAGQVDGTACRFLMFAILSVYFWSGIQKLFHGYYGNGEFFALFLFVSEGSRISEFFLAVFAGMASWFGEPAPGLLSEPDWLRPATFVYPGWAIGFLIAQCWLTLVTEIVFPWLVVVRRTRELGLLLLLPTATVIAVVSGETGFALTNAACLLLFFPKQARWSYPLAYLFILVIHYVRLWSFGDG